MKKIHVLGIAVLSMLVVGVVSAATASAATLQWLEDGHAMAAAAASETTGEILLKNSNGGGLSVNAQVLCSGSFMGTVGPGVEDEITSVLSLTGALVTLEAPLECENESNCATPLVSAVNLPWLTDLELMTGPHGEELWLDVLLAGAGGGNPGWEIDCITIFGLIEETCTGSVGSDLVNDAAENDVLGEFSETEIIELKEQALCSGGNTLTGVTETDLPGLIFLTNGKVLAVSYE